MSEERGQLTHVVMASLSASPDRDIFRLAMATFCERFGCSRLSVGGGFLRLIWEPRRDISALADEGALERNVSSKSVKSSDLKTVSSSS